MQSSTILSLNVQTPNYATVMHAVQFDKLSRKITAYLFDGALPFIPPDGALAMVRYSKPDGTMGFYDTLEDNETAAVTWEGNTATVWLAEQVLTVAGNVICQIQFFTSTERLSTFTFVIGVEANAVSDESIESTDYFSILTQRIEAILGAVAYPPSINAQGHWMLFDTEAQQYYDSGVDATGPQGPTGPTGPYMASIAKTSGTGAPGTTDQYQVTLSDGTHPTGTISVYNGADGQGSPGSATPLMDGTASVGSANAYAREDHRHPSDTTKLPVSALSSTVPVMDGNGSAGSSSNVAREDHVHPSDTSKQDVNLYFENVSVSAWAADSTYSDFPYRGTITCSGVTASMKPEVVFNLEQALSGLYAPVASCGTNAVYIYAMQQPTASFQIPTITVMK